MRVRNAKKKDKELAWQFAFILAHARVLRRQCDDFGFEMVARQRSETSIFPVEVTTTTTSTLEGIFAE